ncbi:MAG: nucleotidyltransferase family protein, partial [Lachnospiraceae bacterium]|nr:nucleotidyltransferase family protein [Lachnospiraceae bacterium]
MKTIGIIAEFNPFHYGHKYLIEEAKKNAQADFCVVVMSGNFVQRGAPALMDKYSRTRMALLGGADLVLELPVCYATASAEYFARGAVRLLDKLGVIDTLCFGSECGDINILENALNLLDNESSFGNDIKKNIKKGMSYPRARAQAIESNINSNININIEATQILNQPNNILGIEYIKALNYF